jgi:hypothetical protein
VAELKDHVAQLKDDLKEKDELMALAKEMYVVQAAVDSWYSSIVHRSQWSVWRNIVDDVVGDIVGDIVGDFGWVY